MVAQPKGERTHVWLQLEFNEPFYIKVQHTYWLLLLYYITILKNMKRV
jgi:hypothetical protein